MRSGQLFALLRARTQTHIILKRTFFGNRAVDGFVGAVGNTPLMRIPSLSQNVDILVKCEFMNPGGSVKDRAAVGLITDAERRGLLKSGGIVVEGTAGNTGIGLAHICRARGYKCIIFMPDTQSQEKIDLLRAIGADVRPVPGVPFENPMNYNHQAKRFAEATPNAVWVNQFDNTANRHFHYMTTGPEIWAQTNGQIDAFVCSTGTGGTLGGVGKFLKEKRKDIKIYCADPPGSVLFEWYTRGVMGVRSGSSITEGIGQGRLTDNLKGIAVDGAVRIEDTRSIEMLFRLLHDEGLFVGASSALNVVAAVDVAKLIGPKARVVTVLCDGAGRYQSRLLSRAWLKSKGLDTFVPAHCQSYLKP